MIGKIRQITASANDCKKNLGELVGDLDDLFPEKEKNDKFFLERVVRKITAVKDSLNKLEGELDELKDPLEKEIKNKNNKKPTYQPKTKK